MDIKKLPPSLYTSWLNCNWVGTNVVNPEVTDWVTLFHTYEPLRALTNDIPSLSSTEFKKYKFLKKSLLIKLLVYL